ncbi:MAG: hypothetical protein RLZZ543_1616, partial [Bacteroidota bacterium]
MRTFLSSLLICLFSFQAFSQVNPGGIAFLSLQSDAPDGFAFVTLQDIPGNTAISFTDNGWSGSALFNNEQTIVWTAPAAGVAIGTVIIMREDTALPANMHNVELLTGPGTVTGELNGLSTQGDQILAYTGPNTSPSFIAAISSNLFLSVCNAVGTGGNTPFTCLPAPLEEGVNALAVPGDSTGADNIFLDLPDFSGSAADILSIINDPENWTYSNDPTLAGFAMWPNWTFSFATPDPSEITFQNGFVSLVEGGASQLITLSISPASFGSQTVQLSLANAITEADLSSSSPFSSGSISLTIPSGSTSVTFNLSAVADGISEGTENGTLTITSASSGLTIGSGNVLPIEITEPVGVSFVSYASTSASIIEGQSTVTVTLDIQPATTTAQSFQVVLSEGTGLTSADYSTSPAASAGVIDVNLAAGATSYSFTVDVNDDIEIESPEELTFSLTAFSSDLQSGLNATSVLTVLDNDAAPVVSDLYINEVMASNVSTVTDENGEFDDWIEIYNASDVPADLANLYITDDVTNTAKYQFPSGTATTVIAPGGFILVWADNTIAQGPLHTNFTLSPGGEYVGLYAANGDLIDSLTYEALGPNQSYGYSNEVDGELMVFEDGFTTPAASNATSSI